MLDPDRLLKISTKMFLLYTGLIIIYFGSIEAGFCTVPYDCDSTCYTMSTYKTMCGTSECYKSRLEPYVCKETCYDKKCCPGYSGDDCLTPLCFGSTTCPNGGQCIAPDSCNCLPGFYGESCSACGILPTVINGQFKLHTTAGGTETVARLECAAGYVQRPDQFPPFELHCDSDGFWSPENIPVTCGILDCGLPNKTVPHGHYVAVNGTHFGNQALLQCDHGYFPEIDDSFIECRESGKWSDSSTQCVNECPTGWINHDTSCYLFVMTEMNYTDARSYCQMTNASLVQVDTILENIFLKNVMFQFDKDNNSPHWGYWNDLFETTINGQEVWRESNTPLNPLVIDWAPGQPDDQDGQQSCSMYYKDKGYQWVDIECNAIGRNDTVHNNLGIRAGRPICERKEE